MWNAHEMQIVAAAIWRADTYLRASFDMLYVDNNGITDARLNLALEEHILRNRMDADDLLLFYVNAPAIIIGRNQNTIEEINADVVAERGIRVVRRVSGGGAVYHDLGNLNFSFMTRDVSARFNRYDLFNRPVVEVLRELGVPAEIGGRNDILADGRKISGNAQFATAGRMFSHGTLLLDSNLDDVTAALRPKPGKVESKGVKSIRSRVANIREFLREPSPSKSSATESWSASSAHAIAPASRLSRSTRVTGAQCTSCSSGATGTGAGTSGKIRRATCTACSAFLPARSTRTWMCTEGVLPPSDSSATTWGDSR